MTALDVLIAQDLEIGTASPRTVLALAFAAGRENLVWSIQSRYILRDPSINYIMPLREALIKAGCKPMIHAEQEDR